MSSTIGPLKAIGEDEPSCQLELFGNLSVSGHHEKKSATVVLLGSVVGWLLITIWASLFAY